MSATRLTDDNISDEVSPISISDLWNTINRRKWIVILTTLAILILAGVYIYITPTKYLAQSVILLENSERNLTIETVIEGESSTDTMLVPSQIQVLLSRGLMRSALEDIGIIKSDEKKLEEQQNAREEPAELRSDETTQLLQEVRDDQAIADALNNLTVEQVEKSRAIAVGYLSRDPDLAARLVTQLTRNYIDQQLDWRLKTIDRTNSWLTDRVAELQEHLRKTETEIVEYRKKEGLVDSRGRQLIEQDISELSERLTMARADLSAASSRTGHGGTSDPAVLSSPLIQQLRSQESVARNELAELQDELGSQHPRIIAARAKVDQISSQISSEIGKISSGLRNEAGSAAGNVAQLEQKLAELKDEYNAAGSKSVQLQALEREAETSSELLETLNLRLKETQSQVDERLQDATAEIISQATVPTDPASPKIKLILIGALIAGLGLGVALAIALDQLERTVFNGHQLQRLTHVTNIALIPKVKADGTKSPRNLTEYPIIEPYSLYSESIRSVSTYLRIHANTDEARRVYNFTSATSNEGKSTLVASLARQMASEGSKVLVIDCDIRQPSLTRTFKLEDKAGFSDMLNGASLDSVIHADKLSNAHVMGVGSLQDSNIISRGIMAWQEFIATALKAYDIILLDSPPLLSVSDTRLLAGAAHNIVCVRWKKTPAAHIRFVQDTLKRHNGDLLATVISMVDVKKSSVYNYMDPKYYQAPPSRA